MYEDDEELQELAERQQMLKHLSTQDAETMLADIAIHLALTTGKTPHMYLAGLMASLPWTGRQWEEDVDDLKETLGLE